MKLVPAKIFISLLISIAFISTANSQRPPKFSDWAPVTHLPPPINSPFDDQAPVLSKDEKTLFFTSNRPGSFGGSEDIWISTRKTKNSPWSRPQNIGVLNTPSIERLRSLTPDGRVMLFMSDRPGSNGQTDIWATSRKNTSDNFAWSVPVNLGPNINSESGELAARYLFSDGGRTSKLFFSSNKPGGFGNIGLGLGCANPTPSSFSKNARPFCRPMSASDFPGSGS